MSGRQPAGQQRPLEGPRRPSVFEEASAVLGADVVEDLRAQARAMGPHTEAELTFLVRMLEQSVPEWPIEHF